MDAINSNCYYSRRAYTVAYLVYGYVRDTNPGTYNGKGSSKNINRVIDLGMGDEADRDEAARVALHLVETDKVQEATFEKVRD